jgi:hypothetical protein
MKTYPFYLLCLLMMTAFSTGSQTTRIDGLKNELYHSTGKSERLNILLALGSEQHSLNRDTAYAYAGEAGSTNKIPAASRS